MTTLTLRQGLNGYAGCVDTYIRSNSPDSNYATHAELSWDGYDGESGQQRMSLIRFDGVFGTVIQSSAVITSATLRVNVFDAGDAASVHASNVSVCMLYLRSLTCCGPKSQHEYFDVPTYSVVNHRNCFKL